MLLPFLQFHPVYSNVVSLQTFIIVVSIYLYIVVKNNSFFIELPQL